MNLRRSGWLLRKLWPVLVLVLILSAVVVPGSGAATTGWDNTASMAAAHSSHTATLLPDGKVFVAGGYNGSIFLSSAELYRPARKVIGDFEGDGKTDFTVWRSPSGTWYAFRSSDGGVTAQNWGLGSAGDVPIH